jgi:hypothetical protein
MSLKTSVPRLNAFNKQIMHSSNKLWLCHLLITVAPKTLTRIPFDCTQSGLCSFFITNQVNLCQITLLSSDEKSHICSTFSLLKSAISNWIYLHLTCTGIYFMNNQPVIHIFNLGFDEPD